MPERGDIIREDGVGMPAGRAPDPHDADMDSFYPAFHEVYEIPIIVAMFVAAIPGPAAGAGFQFRTE